MKRNNSELHSLNNRPCQEIIKPDQMEYKYKVGDLEFEYLYGDSSKKGYYVFRVKVPPNNTQPPHFHRKDEFGLVISGKFYTGDGDKVDYGIKPLPIGSFAFVPKGCHHYAFTKKPQAIVEVSGEGPWVMVIVDENGKPTGQVMELPPRTP